MGGGSPRENVGYGLPLHSFECGRPTSAENVPVITLGEDVLLGGDPRGERGGKILADVGGERLSPADLRSRLIRCLRFLHNLLIFI